MRFATGQQVPYFLITDVIVTVYAQSLQQTSTEMKYKCRFCPFQAERRISLWRHYSLEHGQETNGIPRCFSEHCPQSFERYTSMKSHITTFYGRCLSASVAHIEKLNCSLCSHVLPNFQSFMSHTFLESML